MALEAPLRSSTGNFLSPLSAHTKMSLSPPESPAVQNQLRLSSNTGPDDSRSLRPSSFRHSFSSSNYLMSPNSDIVGPSPVTSNGTETTEIEDEASEDLSTNPLATGHIAQSQLTMLTTNIPDHVRLNSGEEAVSVIHAPESFQAWKSSEPRSRSKERSPSSRSSPRPENIHISEDGVQEPTLPTPPPISTDVRPVRYSIDSATPRAQNLQEVLTDSSRLRSSSASSLELIPENHEGETDEEVDSDFPDSYRSPDIDGSSEVTALKTALEECWTLCNTLATLSSIHRERVFNSSGTPDAHEKAWKSCWKLCQRLYNSREENSEWSDLRINLDLCRDFCQSLFDVRQRRDESADSVLRVSFELNNHLYSAQDTRNLPEAFRERTLDFYITLCHRLMKQRSELAEETDSLLRACWSLAEMLFSLRQNMRDGKAANEELLGSAVQACWELCDIFRAGWTQIRPDRGTPRPSHMSFFPSHGSDSMAGSRSNTGSRASVHSKRDSLRSLSDDRARKEQKEKKRTQVIPETPVTEFEDTPISPESASPHQLPNILVLGTGTVSTRGGRWSSSASNLSSYSHSSAKTSSTATTIANSNEDVNVTRIKALILKAAMNIGFSREAAASDGTGGASSLQAFVKSLPTGSFGALPAHATLLQNYKNLVLADSAFRGSPALPPRGKRVAAPDMSKSVTWMMSRSGQYGFLRELYRLVFGFSLDEADARKNVSIAV